MTSDIKDFICVGTGGFAGAVMRYGVSVLFSGISRQPLPLATLAVNAAGSLLIGFAAVTISGGSRWRLFLIVGLLGGFTTFSSFSHETMTLLNDSRISKAIVNVFLNVSLCLCCVFAGFKSAGYLLAALR